MAETTPQVQNPPPYQALTHDALQHVASHLNLRSVARLSQVNRSTRDMDLPTVALHNMLENPHVSKIAGRYQSKLRQDPHMRATLQEIRDFNTDPRSQDPAEWMFNMG